MSKKICIVGAGDAGKSIYRLMQHGGSGDQVAAFLESEEYYRPRKVYGLEVRPLSSFAPDLHQALIALGSPRDRYELSQRLPAETEYATYIHPENQLLAPEELHIGAGSVIFPYCILTRNLRLGKHSLLMGHSVLGHDSRFGDFFTAAARLNTGGHCAVGHQVYCGMSVSIRDRVTICDQVTVGMGAVVVGDIHEKGVYLGHPAQKYAEPGS
ncbi:MAG: hypothetical protein ACAI44_18855 [Candidatus Sericytochromatia bacterium]